jgi:hypothetical protein
MILGQPMFALTAPASEPSALESTKKPKKARKPRPKKIAPPPDPNKPRTADIAKIIGYYLHNVRMQDKSEYVGIFRQILLMTQKGITLAMVSQAVQNYEKDDFTRACPQMRRHSIRKFMMPERIRQWATAANTKTSDKSLAALDRLTKEAIANQTEAPAIPVWKTETPEEDECQSEL